MNDKDKDKDDKKEKKPVGRPKKKERVVTNEEKETVTMVKKTPSKAELDAGVSTVQSVPERIEMSDIQARWRQVFQKYGQLGFEGITNAWGASRSMLNNPFLQNQRIKQINSPAVKLTKSELGEALADPEQHEIALRSVSWGLYYSNYIYQTMLQLNKNTPKYLWYATPLYVRETKKEDIKADSIKVDKILKKFNPRLTFKTIATQVAVEGKCSYLVRASYSKKDVDFLLLQKLNSNQVKITGFGSKQQFIASFNMAIFLQAGYSVEQYPKFIQDTWANMFQAGIIVEDKHGLKKLNPKATISQNHILEIGSDGQWMYWVQIPQDLCYTFYSDGSHPNAFPDAIGMFEDFNSLGDYRWLQGALLSKGVTSILTGEVPMVKDAKSGADQTALSVDTILGYQDFFAENISANVFPFFAPFNDFDLHNIENQPESMDIIFSRLRDLIATSGLSSLLPITDKPSIASVKASEALQAAKNDYLTRQFEQFLNEVVNNNFDLKCDWRVVLHGDIFTAADQESATKELVKNGAKGLIPKLLSFEGLSVEDYDGAQKYMEALGIEIKSNAEVLAEENAERANEIAEAQLEIDEEEEEETAPVGRPAKNENDIDNDNTGTSRDQGNNVSDIK